LLPEEIRREKDPGFLRGEKVNLNRLTLSENWKYHWESATVPQKNALLKEKVKFAQEIFYLLRVVLHEQIKDQEILARLAQWSVNLVDFIDPDDVMTPFIFNTTLELANITAFDNDALIDKLLAGSLTAADLSDDCILIWGMEKSEVVLTETLAVHNRNTEQDGPGFYQKIRPQGSLFVELYRQGNTQRDYSASSLVDSGNTLNLGKKTGAGSDEDYIWRLAIGGATKTEKGKFKWDEGNTAINALYQLLTPDDGKTKYPQFNQWLEEDDSQYRPNLGVPERFIWFGDSSSMHNSPTLGCSFYDVGGTGSNVVLPHDTSLVVAPWETAPPTAGLSLDLTDKTIMIAGTHSTNSAVAVVNVSEPLGGYSDTPGPTADPFDGRLLDTIPAQRGTIPCYKTICLQRLADPNRKHDSICNPYLKVDWSMIDLQAINSKDTANAEGLVADASGMYYSSRQWKTETGTSNIWDRTLKAADLTTDKAGLESNAYAAGSEPKHTLGDSNYSIPLMHFPWNDAPFTNSGELMLVPSSAPGRFGVEFHDNGTGKEFFGKENRFGYYHDESKSAFSAYFNWKDSDSDSDLDMPLLLDFVHVPSRFAGTRTDTGSVYREPGKINLNTVTEEGWKAMQNGRSDDVFPSYEQFYNYRKGRTDGNAVSMLLDLRWQNDADEEKTLLSDNADNPHTALENVLRLSDVTTTRSNVFAIWITVGYFNVEKFDNRSKLEEKYPVLEHITNEETFKAVYPDGYVLGAEMGLDDATVKRHRAFYLIDRSNLLDMGKSTFKFKRGNKLTDDEKQRVVFKETVLD
jgi:hypothetical protein